MTVKEEGVNITEDTITISDQHGEIVGRDVLKETEKSVPSKDLTKVAQFALLNYCEADNGNDSQYTKSIEDMDNKINNQDFSSHLINKYPDYAGYWFKEEVFYVLEDIIYDGYAQIPDLIEIRLFMDLEGGYLTALFTTTAYVLNCKREVILEYGNWSIKHSNLNDVTGIIADIIAKAQKLSKQLVAKTKPVSNPKTF